MLSACQIRVEVAAVVKTATIKTANKRLIVSGFGPTISSELHIILIIMYGCLELLDQRQSVIGVPLKAINVAFLLSVHEFRINKC